MKYAPEALHPGGPEGWQAAQWKDEKESLMYGDRKDEIITKPNQLGITSGRAPVIDTVTPESKIGGELEITPDIETPRDGRYAIMVRTKDKDGVEHVQPYLDKFGRQMRWEPDLESWEPYQKMLKDRETQIQNGLDKAEAVRSFKDKHRALDEQYKRFHAERLQNVPTYIYGGGDN